MRQDKMTEEKHIHSEDICNCVHEHHVHEEYDHENHDHENHNHEDCGCGHTHHDHNDHNRGDCGCGHTHHDYNDHDHEDCGCGHTHHGHNDHDHEDCGCGHTHHDHSGHDHEDCGCGHTHHDHNDHDHEDCGCGHTHHDHSGHDHEVSGCGHEHHEHNHQHESHEGHELHAESGKIKVYILENLGCANCAAKMEKKIQELPEVQDASITFSTKQLRVASQTDENLLPKLQEICASIESEVVVRERTAKKAPAISEKEKGLSENAKERLKVGLGAALFVAGLIIKNHSIFGADICFIISYVILGAEIIITAGKNIVKGNVFDENFLMSLATIGAFCIGDFDEAVGVMLFYRIGELFEEIAVERSRSQIMDAVDMRPEVVNLVSGEEILVVPAEDAKQGDIVMVRPGDRIPLDGTIVDGESRIDTSAVTGEPVPVSVKTGDEVISGCVNTSGLLKVRVDKVLSESMVSRILDSVENAAASKPKMERFITKFARVYTPVVVAVALGTAILPSLITGDWSKWVYTALTFLVISCPCALVLSVPLAFFSGIGAGSKKGILFKGGLSLEAMSRIKAIVMDKTGTITEGNFVVQYVNAVDGHESDELLALAASCELGSTHPIGESIVAAAKNNNLELHRPESVEEISGKGIRAVIDGKEVLCGNYQLLESYHVKRNAAKKEIMGSEVLVACDGKYLGNLVIDDTVKADAVNAIAAIKKQGIATVMLTGDAVDSAKAVAAETGIDEYYAKLLPVDKVNKLKSIRKKYGPVMFVGDGINDAPVLAGADVGAAMGSGADAAIEAADVVFMTSSVEAIPQSMKIARNVNQIAVQNVVFALVIKALVMILGLFGYANMWMAVFADTGVAMLCVLNSIRVLYSRKS
ncbi:MAG: heavy metal translocating P-type ATPase [Lachnospiraceae bacterium]|nr:heavy metal translocating P-type ATPase [Lachnospiraceae bacterium]